MKNASLISANIAKYTRRCQQEQIKWTPQKECHVSIHEVKVQKVVQTEYTIGKILLLLLCVLGQ